MEDFKKGVFIDFERYKKDFFNDDIISKFKGNLEGIVENDKEKFKVHLYEGSRKEPLFFDEKNAQFMFNDLDLLEKITLMAVIKFGLAFDMPKNMRMEVLRIQL